MGLTIYQVVIESYKKNSNGVDTINQSGWYMSQVYHSLGQALKHYEVCQKRVFDKHLPVKCIGRGQCKDMWYYTTTQFTQYSLCYTCQRNS